MNKNSNTYIVLYATVMVVIVAALLATVATVLKTRQGENALNEKKQQIVKALGENPEVVSYDSVIASAIEVTADGQTVDNVDEKQIFAALADMKSTLKSGQYPVFVAKNGCIVVPVYGAGLWDAIWGYVALEPDMNTIRGVVLDHKGETPGLGAEIATEKHQAKYVGKTIFNDAEFVGITLVKGGANPSAATYNHDVDAITGGTKTSNGVTDMLKSCLANYISYFEASKPAPAVQEPAAEEVNNQINTENNEQ